MPFLASRLYHDNAADVNSNDPQNADQQAPVPHPVIREYLIAVALQQLEMVFYYIECVGIHPDTTWGGKPTAICYAAMKGNHRLLNYLIDKGASVNCSDVLGMTPLHYATLGGCESCVATLINRGADLNAIDQSGKTPLNIALKTPHLVACRELLLQHGASLKSPVQSPQQARTTVH